MQIAQTNLWGEEFSISTNKEKTDKILKKILSPKKDQVDIEKLLKSAKTPIETKLKVISDEVNKILGHYKENTLVIRDKATLVNYIDESIKNGTIAIDTETLSTKYINGVLDPKGGLDYLTCKLAGPCIYTPTLKQAYIPINHVDYKTGKLLDNQLTESDIKEQFQRLIDAKSKIIYHNYKFDYQVLKCTCGLEMTAFWDTMIATKMINELESASLKQQYIDKINPSQAKYDIEHLFTGVEYSQVDPELFALYSATDPMMTYKLYEYQKSILETDDYKGMYKIFREIEMPLIKVVADMEIRGFGIDNEFCTRLSNKYHKLQKEIDDKVDKELLLLKPQIDAWRLTKEAQVKDGKKTKNEQLSDPVKLTSPKQLAILLFDILKFPEGLGKTVYDTPRGTGSNILEILSEEPYNFSLGKALVEKKTMDKLVSTFVDAIPTYKNPKDNKIHTQFNQLGAIARFSSTNPNLQNIPSNGSAKAIRCMFEVDEGKVLVGADLSGAELRAAVNSCRDEALVKCYNDGKDLYSLIGSMAFKCSYDDCCEFYPEGMEIEFQGEKVITGHKTHTNYDGKKRRNAAKKIAIGICYGRGAGSIAEQIGCSIDEAKKLLENVNKGFPGLKNWMDIVRERTTQLGYVDDFLGRRRHLPNALLPKWEFKNKTKNSIVNPFLECNNDYVDPVLVDKYTKLFESVKSRKEYHDLIKEAYQEGLSVIDNQSKIAEAMREAPNWCCQAQTASWIKMNMIAIDNDPILKDLGFELLLTIHDEVQGSVPKENAEKAKERLEYLMSNTIKDVLCIPMPSDGTIEWSGRWYMSEMETLINSRFNELKEEGKTEDEAYKIICEEESEFLPENIYNFLFSHEGLK